MRYRMPSNKTWLECGLSLIKEDTVKALRLLPGVTLKERLDQFFINRGLVKLENGKIKFKPSIARIYRTEYGHHIIVGMYPGLCVDDITKHMAALSYACQGESWVYQDASGWVHIKVYTKHLPERFAFSQSLAERVRRYPLALPIGISRQGLVLLKLYKDEEFGLLIAGMPGWGKSVMLRQMLTTAVLVYESSEVVLYLIDMKRGVEFEPFHSVPHTKAWAGDLPGAKKVLAAVLKELNRRSDMIKAASVTNITEYNRIRPKSKMPHCIVAIDEYGDLGKDEKEVVTEICRKGRFAGIHPIICTQRPTTDVLPGATKGLLPVRVCFRMASKANSRYVLEEDNSAAADLKFKGRAILLKDFAREIQVMNLEQTEARKLIEARWGGVPRGDTPGALQVAP